MSKVVSQSVYPVKRHLFCDCGTEMKIAGAYLTDPIMYRYVCPKCKAVEKKNIEYPFIEYITSVPISELDLTIRAYAYFKQRKNIDTIEELKTFLNDDKNIESLPSIIREDVLHKLELYNNGGE